MKSKNHLSFVFFSLFLLFLAIGLLLFQLSKVPKEVEAVVGTLNFNAQTTSTLNTPGGIWNTSGNVGIGTTGPTDKLNIVTTTAYGGLTLESTVASSYQTALNFKHPNGTTYGRIGFDQNTDSMKLINLSTWAGAGADILFYTNNDTTTPKMAISRGGLVGIGTTAPGYKLDVAGTGNFTGTVTTADLTVSGSTNICNLVAYTATSGVTYCPAGFYVWSANAATTGQILCCKVSNPI